MLEETAKLQIIANRGGSITEISAFLSDLENAYMALYVFDQLWLPDRIWRRFRPELFLELGYPFQQFGTVGNPTLGMDAVPPNARLTLERVRIESPGFWEFFASLNPLQQIREYLNDRHKRRQDREYREPLEKERLELENEQIRQQIEGSKIANLREKLELLREIGYDDNKIRNLIWMNIGTPLTRLGRHQDTGLIGGAECKSDLTNVNSQS